MLTTPKYRLLQSLHLGFVILDDAIFVLLIVALFIEVQPEFNSLYEVLYAKWGVFLVIAFEVFYDILQLVIQIWLVSRVSVYIVIMLYISYAIAFSSYKKTMWDTQLYVLFFSRVGAFIIETLVDFCIDLELDRDLSTKQKVQRDLEQAAINTPLINDLPNTFCCLKHKPGIAYIINLPEGWDYKGSISAWTWNDTNLCDKEIQKRPLDWDCRCSGCDCGRKCGCQEGQWHHIILVPLALMVSVILIILLCIPAMLLTILKKICAYCCGLNNHSILGEFRDKQI